MPGGGQRAVRVVLVEEVPLLADDLPAEEKEALGQLEVAGPVERVGDARAIAGPEVAVGVPPAVEGLRVDGGHDGAVVVHVGTDDEEAPAVEPVAGGGQIGFVAGARAAGPEAPVGRGAGAQALVVDHAAEARVVERGIPDVVAADAEIVVEEETDLPACLALVENRDAPGIDVLMEIHGVGGLETEAQPGVARRDARDQGVVLIVQRQLPSLADPGELTVHPDAEAEGEVDGVVLPADHGVEQVPDLVGSVEPHQQGAVGERDVPRHSYPFSCFEKRSSVRRQASWASVGRWTSFRVSLKKPWGAPG